MLYGIIADVHGNLEALNAVLAELKKADKIVSAGDLVGYGPDPNECVEKIIKKEVAGVAGNHEKAVVGQLDLEWFNPNAKASVIWTQGKINPGNSEYFKSLPEVLKEDEFQVVHGSLKSPFLEYILSIVDALPTFEKMEKPVCFAGHTHRPLFIARKHDGFYDGRTLLDGEELFIEEYDKVVINVGAVGQPRDGDPRASFGFYNSKIKIFSLHRVAYDIEKVQKKMQKAGLRQPLIDRLKYGR